MRKWDGSPHRQTTEMYLGSDEHGRWLGNVPGVEVSQPGVSYTTSVRSVTLAPNDGCFLAGFNAPPTLVSVYTDITTVPEFGHDTNGWVLAAVDMVLDVVGTRDGQIWIDDEDEFAEHTATYAYPAELVASARTTADAVLAAVREGTEPFGSASRRWFNRLGAIATGT